MIQDADSVDEEEDTDDGVFMQQELEDEEEQPGIQCNIIIITLQLHINRFILFIAQHCYTELYIMTSFDSNMS